MPFVVVQQGSEVEVRTYVTQCTVTERLFCLTQALRRGHMGRRLSRVNDLRI